MHISTFFDQSLYVRASIQGVIREGIIAACLTAVMILLFLGNWKSTLIIAVSIPLSILVSILCLSALGQTINIMTLGGLALAVGILVDDATVEIENIKALSGILKNSGKATEEPWAPLCDRQCSSPYAFWLFAVSRSCSSEFSAAISFQRLTPDRSDCTCALARACALRKQRASPTK